MIWKKINNTVQNIYGIFRAEILESFNDAGTVLIFFVAALLYPMLYSIGYVNETIREIPVAVVDLDHTSLSRQYSRMLDATEQVKISCKPGSLKEAEALFYQGKIQGVVLISGSFEKNIFRGEQGKVTVYCDAGRFFVYKQVYTAATYVTGTMNAGVEIKGMLARGKMWDEAVNHFEAITPQMYDLYNPASGYATFIVPGILIIVIQQSLLVGIGLLFGKHYERKKLIATGSVKGRVHNLQIILGKSMVYVTLYLITTLVTLVLFYHWLSFPDKTSFFNIYPPLILYLFAVSFMGISISVWFRKRVHTLMFIVFLSPMVFFLCGIAWPMESLPGMVKMLGFLFPTTPMLPAFLKLRMMGGDLGSVRYEITVLFLQMVGYFILAMVSNNLAMKRNSRMLRKPKIQRP
ncbi:MAG: ABC transporter permease [Bacteroidota bacterium]